MKKIKFKIFPDRKYNEIISAIGENRYGLFSNNETLPGDVFSSIKELKDCKYALVGTGATTSCYVIREIKGSDMVIPKGAQVFVGRFLKYDNNHSTPHFNAYDQIVFPTQNGHILSFARNDAPDHFIKITELSSTKSLADAYKLPEKKSGTIAEYKEKGASIHLEPEPFINL